MPAKRRGKAVIIPSSPAHSFGTSQRPKPLSRDVPGPGAYNVHGETLKPLTGSLKKSKRTQIDPRGNVITERGVHPSTSLRSSPAYTIASKPFSAASLDISPGPGEYDAHKNFTNPAPPAFSLASLPAPDRAAGKSPGPGKYKWAEADKGLRPGSPPVSMKFRRGCPEDKTRRPAPNEYSPSDPLKIYKGEYTKITVKLRRKPKLVEFIPEPGPGEYSPSGSDLKRQPAYTIRDKLASELDPPPYPGPGQYDVEESTIGNWGAGMAAGVPPRRDIFLQERIEMFRRGAQPGGDREFLNKNREELRRLREEELAAAGGSAALAAARRKAKAKAKAVKRGSGAGGNRKGLAVKPAAHSQPLYIDA